MSDYVKHKPNTAGSPDWQVDQSKNTTARPAIDVIQTNNGLGGTVALVILVLVAIAAAYLFYPANSSTGKVSPAVTQNTTTLPAPAAVNKVPLNPPAVDKIAPAQADPVKTSP